MPRPKKDSELLHCRHDKNISEGMKLMNIKELQTFLKKCNCGIEFKKDERGERYEEYKDRYYLYAWPTSACGSGSFYFQNNRYFIIEPSDFDRPRFEEREVSEQEFIKEVLDFFIYHDDQYNIREKNPDVYEQINALYEQNKETLTSQIVFNRIIPFLPSDWSQLIFYAGYTTGSYSMKFYYKETGNHEYIDCFSIPGISKADLIKLFMDIDKTLSMDRILSDKKMWTIFTLTANSSGYIKSDYEYEDHSEDLVKFEATWERRYLRDSELVKTIHSETWGLELAIYRDDNGYFIVPAGNFDDNDIKCLGFSKNEADEYTKYINSPENYIEFA